MTVRGHRIVDGEAWIANFMTSFGVDESHPRLVRMSELVQKSETAGLTDEEMMEYLRESDLLDDEVIPIWNAAHPDRIIHGGRRGTTTEKWFAAIEAILVDKNNSKVARILEVRNRQHVGTISIEEMKEYKRLFDELMDEAFMKRRSKVSPPDPPKQKYSPALRGALTFLVVQNRRGKPWKTKPTGR